MEITKEHIEANIKQKAVDMRIGLEIASLTLKKLVNIIDLVTGDTDFVPAMKFARREGCQVYLVTFGQQINSTLIEHSDLIIEC